MPINRTPFNALIDDNGTGLDGSIWNKAAIQGVLLDPIDAFVNSTGTWTPTDASGGGLTLTVTSAKWYRVGQLIFFWAHVTYPANSNGAGASIAGLPFANTSGQFLGGYLTFGPPSLFHLAPNGTSVLLLNPATYAVQPNSVYSSAQIIFQGFYHIA